MTHFPDPFATTPPLRRARPARITVAAVIGIVLSVITLIYNCFDFAGTVYIETKLTDPAQKMSRGLIAFSLTQSGGSILLAIAWIVLSIMLLMLARPARRLSLAAAVIHLIVNVVEFGVSLMFAAEVTRVTEARANADPNLRAQLGDSIHNVASMTGYVRPIVAVMCGSIVPIVIAIILLTRAARAAFAMRSQAAAVYAPQNAPKIHAPLSPLS